ncbi:MAG: O-antigen ligase [Polaribacter sp.]|jgi:O-antigen ligase
MIAKRIDNVFDIVFSMLLFSLSISMAIPNLMLVLLFLVFLFKRDKIKVGKWYAKLLFMLVLYVFLKALFFNALVDNFSIYKHFFVVLVLSFLVYNIKNIAIVIKGSIFGIFLGVMVSLFKISNFYFIHKVLPFGNTAEVQDLLLIHRPYFGFMCLITIVLIDVLLPKIKSKKEKILYVIIGFIIAVFMYIIVARLSLFLLIGYLTIKTINYVKLSLVKSVLGALTILILMFGAFSLNKNIKNRLHIEGSYIETIKVLKNQEPRFVIWDCFFSQVNNKNFNVFFGYNNRKSIQEELNGCYEERIDNISKRDYYVDTEFNTHNQFFDIFLEGGILGLSLFLALFIFLVSSFRENLNALFILLSFTLFFIFENLFHRQLGAYLFGVFIPLFHKIIAIEKK